jgi:hypothetical protein
MMMMKTIQKSILNSTNSTTNEDYFQTAFESGMIKSGVVVSYFISAIAIIPLAYGIIWFERYGSDHKRIILNRIVSSICWSGIEYYSIVQVSTFHEAFLKKARPFHK